MDGFYFYMNEENKQTKSAQALREEVVLKFWQGSNIFEKTLEKESPKGEFVFYEGPPTANAKPALHHLEARAFKDVIPRYKTMQGYSVPRRAGWDTHGLPVELQIEKKLGLTSKKEIENYGVALFNKECKESVFTYIKDWEDFSDRIGYWVDKKNAYYTFNNNYIESLWNIVCKVNERGLLYKDYKVIPWCPRCGTALSSHELGQPGAYIDVKDLTVYVKFKIVGTDNGYFVAWTTTPWTLPGNVALAVGSDIVYVEAKIGEDILVLAKDRLEILGENYEILAEHKGSEMVGMAYEPIYIPQPSENSYQIYTADFVDTETGTGIVHIAPMYGVDDFELATNNNLPKNHTVDDTGHFISDLTPAFLSNRFVKDEEVAVDIIKDLAHRGQLFKKEKYDHPYPHCWRCKTPLLYYARDSWYIAMSKLKHDLVDANEGINWEPGHIKEGRFGEWLENIKDWAVSRERYWGTPLPVWTTLDGEIHIVESVDKLKSLSKKSGNKYFVMRHGQTENNVKNIWSCDSNISDVLTDIGKAGIKKSAQGLIGENIDMIIASPFSRTRETAEMVAEIINYPSVSIVTDIRLGEWNIGSEYDRKPLEDFFAVRNKSSDRYNFKFEDGESYADVLRRSAEFFYDIESQYQGKNILIISHGATTRGLELTAQGYSLDTLFEQTRNYKNFENAEVRQINFVPLPHNENFELDLHKPYIDQVELETKDGQKLTRVKEVMDVWFDSGAMPFAQEHYPFESKEVSYPADFISEAIDQTRGWFYTLHAVGTLMGRGKAYKNAICLGHILDSEGKKMSKSVGNIVDPVEQIEKYGVDTLRFWMYSVTQPGDSKNYDEKVVKEMQNKIFGLLYNVISFYELYRDKSLETDIKPSDNSLDQWIMARLNQFIALATESLDNYKIFEPARGFRDLIDDLSTWYLRRSRDRIKDGDTESKRTLYIVLKTISQLIAPFAPFAAEDIWQTLKNDKDEESVHLTMWPKAGNSSKKIIEEMELVRKICTLGNALRKKSGIPVRQPLGMLKVKSLKLKEEYLELIKDELNVKEVIEDTDISDEAKLDLDITPELKKEGDYRELVRAVQDMRKEMGLEPSDFVSIVISVEAEGLLSPFMDEFKKTVQAKDVVFEKNDGQEVRIDEMVIHLKIEK